MVDTPFAVISREPERVKVSLVLVPIQHCLCTEQYVSSIDYYVNDIYIPSSDHS